MRLTYEQIWRAFEAIVSDGKYDWYNVHRARKWHQRGVTVQELALVIANYRLGLSPEVAEFAVRLELGLPG